MAGKFMKRKTFPVLAAGLLLCVPMTGMTHVQATGVSQAETQTEKQTETQTETQNGTETSWPETVRLKNVRNAPEKKGKWVKRKGGNYAWKLEDGTVARNEWLKIKNKIYRFDENGFRITGWHSYLGRRYYAATDGAMVTGWQKIGKFRYYFKKNGVMASSEWIRSRGEYYYFGTKGRMKKGWLTMPDGKKYYLDSRGVRVTGDFFIKDKGYHFNDAGVYQPGVKVTNAVNPEKPMIALTFDDGPGPYTDRLLKCLKDNHAAATFFLVGRSVEGYRDTVKRAYQMGCELGNHSWDHPQFTQLDPSAIASQIGNTSRAIKNACGHEPTLLRPPYGAYNSMVASSVGMPMILWEVDTLDWKTRDVQSTIASVMSGAKDGAIVLMHDIHLPTVIAVESIVPQLKNKGYQLVTVSDLAKYKKKNLYDGSVYSFIR